MVSRRTFLEQDDVAELLEALSDKAQSEGLGFVFVFADEKGTSVVSNFSEKVRLAALLAQTAAQECELALKENQN